MGAKSTQVLYSTHLPAARNARSSDRGRATPTVLISILPKDSVTAVIGYLKSKAPDPDGREISNASCGIFVGHKLWARR
jgi:hypothetical protein